MCNKEQMFCQLAAFVARFLCFQTHGPTAHVTKSWAGLLTGGPRDQGIGMLGVFGRRDLRDAARGRTALACWPADHGIREGIGMLGPRSIRQTWLARRCRRPYCRVQVCRNDEFRPDDITTGLSREARGDPTRTGERSRWLEGVNSLIKFSIKSARQFN
jgi:hypothetical protein